MTQTTKFVTALACAAFLAAAQPSFSLPVQLAKQETKVATPLTSSKTVKPAKPSSTGTGTTTGSSTGAIGSVAITGTGNATGTGTSTGAATGGSLVIR
jgi:hypothetical protein